MAGGKRVVADEHHLRIALRQQLQHNEQQNLAMTKMSQGLGRAGRLVTDIKKLSKKGVSDAEFSKGVTELLEKFEKTSARGTKGPKRGS